MRIFVAACAVFLFSALPVLAAPADTSGQEVAPKAEAPSPPQTREQKLDKLFADLKRERNEQMAKNIAGRIYTIWNQSGSASIDLMMQWSQKAIEDKKYDVALDFLDEVTTLQPTYAEGWNRRATVHFLMKNYSKSMVDIEKTLELEPRHFGALSGMAQIMTDMGRKEQALGAWEDVLAIYPMLRNAQEQVTTISDDLAGESI
jgi:tetratricopeptide (TPR) repeat protein